MVFLALLICAGSALVFAAGRANAAGAIYLYSCSGHDNATGAWTPASSGAGMTAGNDCPEGRLRMATNGTTYQGDAVQWSTTVPSQMVLFAVNIPSSGMLVNPNAGSNGYGLRFFWTGGEHVIADSGNSCCGGMDYGAGFGTYFTTSTQSFIMQASCNQETCGSTGELMDVGDIELVALDGTAPSITPTGQSNLAYEKGQWVRGAWNVGFTGQSQAGVCQAYIAVDGNYLAGQQTPATPSTGSWTQCGAPSGADTVTSPVDTTQYPNGAMTLQYYAADAAQPANIANNTYSVNVDNEPVSLSLAGSTGYDSGQVTATASAGPSGVAGIWCSVNGQASPPVPAATATINLDTLGVNTVSCYAENNAVDSSGQPGTSPTQTISVDIQQPTYDAISFTHLIDALRCSRRRERVHFPARWVTQRFHGTKVRVRIPAQTRRVTVVHCHPRTVKETQVVHGKTVTERVVQLPEVVQGQHDQVAHGQGVTVNGWLGYSQSSNAIANAPVQILTAPANGSHDFTPLETVKTDADGGWSALIPPGPSRVIKAVYAGTDTLGPATSQWAYLNVTASPTVSVHPVQTHWGSTITISGRLRGGYIPQSGELVVLRIGWKGGSAQIGHVYTNPDGSFRTTYTFLRGSGSERYRIWAETVRESDYPFAPASSGAADISVS
jgi:hypothetical protein